jgi:RNA polymerase sigma-70 factor (ECF subfamily)
LTARESAFSAFFEAHERRLRAFALRRTSNPVAADDLVAATMAIAWTKFEEVEPASAFGWLCGTAIRVQANDSRMQRRWQAHVERLVAEAENRPLAAYLESDTLLAEQREAIAAAFERLPQDDRELLRLAVWDGLDDDELAAAFGINAAAARKRLSRARRRFRELYAQVTAEPTAGQAGG